MYFFDEQPFFTCKKIFLYVFCFYGLNTCLFFQLCDAQLFDTLQRIIVFLKWPSKAFNLSVFLASNISGHGNKISFI